MYKEFINELMKEFPKIDKIKDEKFAFIKFKGDHMKRFMKRLRMPDDYGAMVQERNPDLFSTECKLVKDIGLDEVWPQADDQTKESIWQCICARRHADVHGVRYTTEDAQEHRNDGESDRQGHPDERKGHRFSQMMKSVEGMMQG